MVFANFKGLTVAEQNEMRKALRAQNIGYTVAKKSLLAIGLKDGKFEGEMPALEGEVAFAYGRGRARARAGDSGVREEIRRAPGVRRRMFGGKFVGKEEITSIAAIPGMETLAPSSYSLSTRPVSDSPLYSTRELTKLNRSALQFAKQIK